VDDLSVVYYGHLFDATGYGQAARGYVRALHAAGVRVCAIDLMHHGPQVHDELVESLVDRGASGDFHVFHGIPPQWGRLAFPLRNVIGMTVWETDTMPLQWRTALSHVMEVWLPCDFNVSVFQRGLRTPIFKLPHVVQSRSWNGEVAPHVNALEIPSDAAVFYSIFEWQERKGPADLLTAYLRAFADVDDTLLVIKTNPGAAVAAAAALASARASTRSEARVSIRAEAWSDAQLEALHQRGDVYVSLHRGEGWCYPLFDAATRGTPVVATAYGGPLEYLSKDSAELVPYDLVPVRQRYLYYHPTMKWAQPDVGGAVIALRHVYADRTAARARAARGAERILRMYSPEAVGAIARAELMQLLRRSDAARWQRVHRLETQRLHKPPVPIPGTWYDRGYFEDGTKSNWHDGYTWSSFAGVFTETAAFLASTFDPTASYLDVGCGKGFLVRALREAGRACWGIDHSPWAVEHAEPAARPHVMYATADALPIGRRVDVVVALDVLAHLTEAQARAFLEQARAITDVAIVAVINSLETDRDSGRVNEADADLSHILMRTHAWWHETFLATGWRQDAVARALARRCQQHELVRKMGWQMYVYTPD
jgi:2-polyprenyl-3-methyl-5-hydroxy-6-metoxy-1,4-benzoquinol methylase/glycosyltransferase involved in cell wall biosynthesis